MTLVNVHFRIKVWPPMRVALQSTSAYGWQDRKYIAFIQNHLFVGMSAVDKEDQISSLTQMEHFHNVTHGRPLLYIPFVLIQAVVGGLHMIT